MMKKKRMLVTAGVALGVILFGSASQVIAASITAEEFVANVQPTVEFMVAAGQLAIEASNSNRVRALARSQIKAQTAVDAAISTWRRGEIRSEAAAEASSTIDRLAPITKVITVPFDVVTSGNRALGSPFAPLVSTNDVSAGSNDVMSRLGASRGADFDLLYVASQRDALQRLSRVYKDFILNGDAPTLRMIAVKSLPQVQHEIFRP